MRKGASTRAKTSQAKGIIEETVEDLVRIKRDISPDLTICSSQVLLAELVGSCDS